MERKIEEKQTQFGPIWIVWQGESICGLYFGKKELIEDFPDLEDAKHVETSFGLEKAMHHSNSLCFVGTLFQKKVWKELLRIPFGEVRTYSEVARAINKPNAVRAVASAIAKNKINLLVPCHRVIRKGGDIGNYRFGTALKQKLLSWEKSLNSSS